MLKPLLRTLPTLSGNIKIACELTDIEKIDEQNSQAYVRYAQLLPISSGLAQHKCDVSLLKSSYEFDIKKFYKYYNDIFFDDCFELNKTDYQKINKHNTIKQRNTDFEFGCKRVSFEKNGSQFAFYAPIYIESVNDLPDYFLLTINLKNEIYTSIRTIKINITNNGDYKYNHLNLYLKRYAEKLDSDVIYCLPQSNQATYYGINLRTGGFIRVIDNIISKIYNKQLTINNFDATITTGWKRNSICMKQILPLSFYFNINDILTDNDKLKFANTKATITGAYYKNGKEVKFYNIDTDYINLKQEALQFNEDTGIMDYVSTKINILDVEYPSLNDAQFIGYKYSNKVSPMYNRWKLKYSSDNHPYFTNISFAFSKNQNSMYKYGEFPETYESLKIIADDENNIILPLGVALTKEDSPYYGNYNLIENYKTIMNNYASTWFDIISGVDSFDCVHCNNPVDIIDGVIYYRYDKDDCKYVQYSDKEIADIKYRLGLPVRNPNHISSIDIYKHNIIWYDNEWANVTDDKAYYKGILYDLSSIYKSISGIDHIDKFSVFVKLNFEPMDRSMVKKIKSAKYSIFNSDKYMVNKNCLVSQSVPLNFSSGDFDGNVTTFFITGDTALKNEVNYTSLYIEETEKDGDFIDLINYGFNYYNVNRYYKLSEIEYVFSDPKCGFPYIFSDLLSHTLNSNDYIIDGFELLPIYRLSEVFDDNNNLIFEQSKNKNNKWLKESLYFSHNGNYYKNQYDTKSLKEMYNDYKDAEFAVPLYIKDRFISYTSLKTIFYENLTNTVAEETAIPYIKLLTEYEFSPIVEYHDEVIAQNVFTRRDIFTGRTYGDSIPTADIEADKDLIYVDQYNMNNVIEKYNERFGTSIPLYNKHGEKLDNNNSCEFFAKFLDDAHLRYYFNTLYNNIDLTEHPDSALKSIFVKKRLIINKYDSKNIFVKDEYTPLADFYIVNISNILKNIQWSDNYLKMIDSYVEDFTSIWDAERYAATHELEERIATINAVAEERTITEYEGIIAEATTKYNNNLAVSEDQVGILNGQLNEIDSLYDVDTIIRNATDYYNIKYVQWSEENRQRDLQDLEANGQNWAKAAYKNIIQQMIYDYPRYNDNRYRGKRIDTKTIQFVRTNLNLFREWWDSVKSTVGTSRWNSLNNLLLKGSSMASIMVANSTVSLMRPSSEWVTNWIDNERIKINNKYDAHQEDADSIAAAYSKYGNAPGEEQLEKLYELVLELYAVQEASSDENMIGDVQTPGTLLGELNTHFNAAVGAADAFYEWLGLPSEDPQHVDTVDSIYEGAVSEFVNKFIEDWNLEHGNLQEAARQAIADKGQKYTVDKIDEIKGSDHGLVYWGEIFVNKITEEYTTVVKKYTKLLNNLVVIYTDEELEELETKTAELDVLNKHYDHDGSDYSTYITQSIEDLHLTDDSYYNWQHYDKTEFYYEIFLKKFITEKLYYTILGLPRSIRVSINDMYKSNIGDLIMRLINDSDYQLEYEKTLYNMASSDVLTDLVYDKQGYWMFSDNFNQLQNIDAIVGIPELNEINESTFKFELVYKKRFIKVNENIYNMINVENNDEELPYKDLYLYTIEEPESYPKILKFYYTDDLFKLNTTYETTACLTPLFDNIYMQNRVETAVYREYNKNNISPTTYLYSETQIGKYYRYDANNVNIMYDISNYPEDGWPIIGHDVHTGETSYYYTRSYISNYYSETGIDLTTIPGNKVLTTYNLLDNCKSYLAPAITYIANRESYISYSYTDYQHPQTGVSVSYTNYSPYTFNKIYGGEYKPANYEFNEETNTYSVWTAVSYEYYPEYNVYSERFTYDLINYDDIHAFDGFKINSYTTSYTYTYSYLTNTEVSYLCVAPNGEWMSYEITYLKETEVTGYATGYVTYGFLMIDATIDNTASSFNVVDKQYRQKKYFSYINENYIYRDNYSINDTFPIILPFTKLQLLKTLHTDNKLLVNPNIYTVSAHYKQAPLYTPTGNQFAYDIILHEKPLGKLSFERYMDSIVPNIVETTSIQNAYSIKYKDIDASFDTTYEKSTIYNDKLNIYRYSPVRIYNANNSYSLYYPLEYKYFNDNVLINLEEEFTIFVSDKLTYNEMLAKEENGVVLEAFEKYINYGGKNTYTEDEILFLYNRYNVQYDSVCVGLNTEHTEKLYSLTYKFILL